MINKPRQRCTSATRQRVENMKKIIMHLRAVGQMPRDDINLLLGYSESGGRKYIQELAADDIIMIVDFEPKQPRAQAGAPIYGLNKDAAVVDSFLSMIDTLPENVVQLRAMADRSGPRMQKVPAEDVHYVHMLRDDVEHKPRAVKFRIPAPDPVLAAFFGFAGAV